MLSSFFLKESYPQYYRFFTKMKSLSHQEFAPFLFDGHQGKEFLTIKILQMLNCPFFHDPHHDLIKCQTCSKINTFKEEVGIFTLFTKIHFSRFLQLLKLKQEHIQLDFLSQETILRKIHKILQILQIQLYKENSSFKITESQWQKIIDFLESFEKSVYHQTAFEVDSSKINAIMELLEKIPLHLPIDYVNHLIQKVSLKSHILPYKTLLIKDPRLLSEIALNRLLKTIEEPPKNLLIIFISSHKKKLLPTILSRCILFNFSHYSESYRDKIKTQFPLYPFGALSNKINLHFQPTNDDLKTREGLIKTLEWMDSQFFCLSPIEKNQKNLIQQFIQANKYYSVNSQHFYEIINILKKRIKK